MDVQILERELTGGAPETVLRRAWDLFGPQVALSSSFQTQSVPLLHMVSQVAPQLAVIFLDTGYHFPETLEFRDRLTRDWSLNVRIARAEIGRSEFVNRHGDDLYRRDPDLCCHINKVEPMRRAMKDFNAWISGIRRDQTAERASARVVEQDGRGLIRLHPLLEWTERDVWKYMVDHALPEHPLAERGYLSIGCAPCTAPVAAGEDARSGRWKGTTKTECGLHTSSEVKAVRRSSD